MSKTGTLALYEITLPNGKVIEISATTEQDARRIAADYELIPAKKRPAMKSKRMGSVKTTRYCVILDCIP